MTESAILAACIQWLGSRSWARCWRNFTGGVLHPRTYRPLRIGLPGSPDIIGFLDGGYFIGVEVKTPTGRIGEAQEAFRSTATRMGCISLIVRSLDDLKAQLAARGFSDDSPPSQQQPERKKRI